MLSRIEQFALYITAFSVLSIPIGFWQVYNIQKNIQTEIEEKRNFYEYEIEKQMRIEAINSSLDILDQIVTNYCLQKTTQINMKEARSVLNKLYFTDKTGNLISTFIQILKNEDNNSNILVHYKNFREEARKQLGLTHLEQSLPDHYLNYLNYVPIPYESKSQEPLDEKISITKLQCIDSFYSTGENIP